MQDSLLEESGVFAPGDLSGAFAASRDENSVAKMLEALVLVGGQIGLGMVSFIDDISTDRPLLDDRGQMIVESVLGWPHELTHWWYGQQMNRHYGDARECRL